METKRLLLRGWKTSDLKGFSDICERKDVMRYIDAPWDTERVADFIRIEQQQLEKFMHCRWALELKDSGQLIGFCGFKALADDHQQLEIGWRLHPSYWRQGLAFEAASHVIRQAILELYPTRIFAKVHVHNAASLALARKLGMKIATRIQVAEFDDFILEYLLD